MPAFVVGLLLAAHATPALHAQQRSGLPPSAQQSAERLRQQQLELERLRQERRTLEQRMRDYQRNAQNVAAERQNLERQAQATARVVRSLDSQLGTLYNEVENVNASLVRTQDELAVKRATVSAAILAMLYVGNIERWLSPSGESSRRGSWPAYS